MSMQAESGPGLFQKGISRPMLDGVSGNTAFVPPNPSTFAQMLLKLRQLREEESEDFVALIHSLADRSRIGQ